MSFVYKKSTFVIPLGFFVRLTFKIDNRMVESFLVAEVCSLPARKLTVKRCFLSVHVLLICNKLLRRKSAWDIGMTLFLIM